MVSSQLAAIQLNKKGSLLKLCQCFVLDGKTGRQEQFVPTLDPNDE